MSRKIDIEVTVVITVRADEGVDFDELVDAWANNSTANGIELGQEADVEHVDVIKSKVIDSR